MRAFEITRVHVWAIFINLNILNVIFANDIWSSHERWTCQPSVVVNDTIFNVKNQSKDRFSSFLFKRRNVLKNIKERLKRNEAGVILFNGASIPAMD